MAKTQLFFNVRNLQSTQIQIPRRVAWTTGDMNIEIMDIFVSAI